VCFPSEMSRGGLGSGLGLGLMAVPICESIGADSEAPWSIVSIKASIKASATPGKKGVNDSSRLGEPILGVETSRLREGTQMAQITTALIWRFGGCSESSRLAERILPNKQP
jgi:hypothetical protein